MIQFAIVMVLVGLLLVATSRWSRRQREVLDGLEPPPSLDPAMAWEAEVAAARAALAAAHVEPRPSAPGTAPLEAVTGQAILFRRHVPPRPTARSYWGGRPTLPADLAWPSYVDKAGNERALGFVVQVACDEVPEGARLGVFPDRGTLFVFMELSWGFDWQWRCLYTPDDVTGRPPAEPPATLPHAYDGRATWGWPTDDADWPRLLPRWSFTPVLAGEAALGDPVEDPRFWPGRVDIAGLVAALPEVAPHEQVDLIGADGGVRRPYPTFPHDWRAALVSLGRVAGAAGRDRFGYPVDAELLARMRDDLAAWTARARGHDPDGPVPAGDADAIWEALTAHRMIALGALRDAVPEAIEATMAHHPDPLSVLPEEARRIAVTRHALASTYDGSRRANINQTMLAPPTCVQAEADERVGEWLLLLELSEDVAIAHHFAEGVLQFWIRPDDLAARRFDRVELTAEAY